jgi:hypothetical protein
MNRQKLITIAILTLVLTIIGAVQAFAYVNDTIATYKAHPPCNRLAGVPRILQVAGFISSGDCSVSNDGTCANSGACKKSASSSKKDGHCVTRGSSCSCE